MTKEELIEKLRRLADVGDIKAAHTDADDALLEYINDAKVSEAYEDIDAAMV